MEIAWGRRPDERVFAILVIIPSGSGREVVTNVDPEIGERLMIGVLQRAQRLQGVELRRFSTHACDAVAYLSRYPVGGPKQY